MMEEFKAQGDMEKGMGNAGAVPQEVMPKPYFATVNEVLSYYAVSVERERETGEGGGWRERGRGLGRQCW